MKLDPPRLRTGGLSGRVLLITHGRYLNGGETLEATRKYDVTEQFEALARERGWTQQPPEPKQEKEPSGGDVS